MIAILDTTFLEHNLVLIPVPLWWRLDKDCCYFQERNFLNKSVRPELKTAFFVMYVSMHKDTTK